MQLPKGFKLIEPATPAAFSDYYQLRWEVLRKDWNRAKGSEKDQENENGIHAMIVDKNEQPIAVCRLQKPNETTGQIRSMAVKAENRKKGFGAIIISYLEGLAKADGLTTIVLDARENAIPFYERMGYKVVSKSYLLFDVIQHYRMEKEI